MSRTEQRYQGEAGRRYQEGKRGLPEAAYPWVARLRAAKLQPWIPPESVVVEFGVGSGWNLAALRCARRVGCDVADFLEPVLRREGIEFVTDSRTLADRLADVVLCHHTLEHVRQPAETLVELRRLLRPGGRLLVYVPSEVPGRYRRFDRDEPNHHLYSWNVQTLGNLVEDCGFRVLTAGLGEFGYDRFAAVWACRLRAGEPGFRALRRSLHLLRPLHEVRLVGESQFAG